MTMKPDELDEELERIEMIDAKSKQSFKSVFQTNEVEKKAADTNSDVNSNSFMIDL